MALSFGYRDDLVRVGRDPEEGTDIFDLSYYVVAEDDLGRRWAHEHAFFDRDGDAKASVERLVRRIEAHVAAGGRLDVDRWVEIDPAYGSEAYQGLDDVGYFAARERHQAREAGEAVPFDQAIDVHFA